MILELYKDLKANINNLLLKTKKISELCRKRDQEIDSWNKDTVYSQETRNQKIKEVWDSYASQIKPLADNALKSLVEIRDSDEIYRQELDFRNMTLKDALLVIDTAKQNLPVETQSAIAHAFRGNIPALRLLKGIYHGYGYWGEQTINNLLKTIPYFAYDEVFTALSKASYDGTWKAPYNLKEFSDFAARMDFNISSNPYIDELKSFIMQYKGNSNAIKIYEDFMERINKADEIGDVEKIRALCAEAMALISATVQSESAV